MNHIVKFQRDNGLKPDGVIGINTLSKIKEVFNLPSDEVTAHYVGQLSHETSGFIKDTENLNYSSKRLLEVFKKYFPTKELADQYANKPEKIGNRVYANRMGNGPESSGDGFKYKGRYSIHTTGFYNYKELSEAFNDPEILSNPDNTIDKYFWKAGLLFFQKKNIFKLTDKVDYNSIRKITKVINGGYNGLQNRYDLTVKYYNILKKKKVNEGQDISRADSISNSDIGNTVVPEKSGGKTEVPDPTGTKKTNNSARFFSESIQRFLSKNNS